ncbi:hypothetical protein LINPERHAP1_LOCUS28221 [Linum perenne]
MVNLSASSGLQDGGWPLDLTMSKDNSGVAWNHIGSGECGVITGDDGIIMLGTTNAAKVVMVGAVAVTVLAEEVVETMED